MSLHPAWEMSVKGWKREHKSRAGRPSKRNAKDLNQGGSSSVTGRLEQIARFQLKRRIISAS